MGDYKRCKCGGIIYDTGEMRKRIGNGKVKIKTRCNCCGSEDVEVIGAEGGFEKSVKSF